MKKNTIYADVSLLLVAFIWGVTFVLVQNAISILEPFTFNAVRFSIASMFLIGWTILFHKKLFRNYNKKLFIAGITMGIWLFSAYGLQTLGLLYTTSSKAGFITGLSVVLVPIFAFFILKLRPKPFALIGVIIATIGLYMLTLAGSIKVNFGDLLVFFCAISFALHIVITGKYTTYFSTLLLTITQISTVAFLSIVTAIFFEDWTSALNLHVIGNTTVLSALIITSIFATSLAFLAQTNFQKHTTPTRVALIFAMEPVFAAITAYFWEGERLGQIGLLGCFLIFLGMILAELPQNIFQSKKTKGTI